jgi:hypothetical protein
MMDEASVEVGGRTEVKLLTSEMVWAEGVGVREPKRSDRPHPHPPTKASGRTTSPAQFLHRPLC